MSSFLIGYGAQVCLLRFRWRFRDVGASGKRHTCFAVFVNFLTSLLDTDEKGFNLLTNFTQLFFFGQNLD